jgi:acyl-CoA thioesterase FadM
MNNGDETWHNSKVTSFTVDGGHIDQYGHVNYKAAPVILEPAQDQLLSDSGTSFGDIEKSFGLRSVVKAFTSTWHGELMEGNMVSVVTKIRLGRTSITFHQLLTASEWKEGEGESTVPVLEQTMVVVLVDKDGKQPIPQALRNMLVEGT